MTRCGLHACLAVIACLSVTACGSHDDSAKAPKLDSAGTSGAKATATPAGSARAATGPLSQWAVVDTSAASTPAYPFNRAFELPPPAEPPDPDALIDRYTKDCSAGAATADCKQLKLDVEGIFLDTLTELRATEDIDPEWYRMGAAAETPQLACISVTELIYLPGRTPEDVALVVKALDSPWRSVRSAVVRYGNKVPGLEGVAQRADKTSREPTCVGRVRDSQPGPEWAGNYPGARYRAFASNPDLRWFSTDDPVEKVLAFFAAQNKPGRTKQELATDASARFVEEARKLATSPDKGNHEMLMQIMQGMAGGPDWSRAFRDLRGIDGEIKYVLLTPDQAIAVFHDDLLKSTAIVASRPPAKQNMQPDMAKAIQDSKVRSIYGF